MKVINNVITEGLSGKVEQSSIVLDATMVVHFDTKVHA